MEKIEKFSNEVCKELKYYVYRLVDPRNGNTFYIGKGKNNRVFAHVKGALKNYEGENYLTKEDDEISLKMKTIREIADAGLEVIHIIQKSGLTEDDALLVEGVLIDVYCLDKLSNQVKGHGSDICPINALTLEKKLTVKEFDDLDTNPKYIMIKIKNYWLSQRNENVYETVRSAWKLSLDRVKKYPYVLAVIDGIVNKVFKVIDWHYANGNSGRVEFDGVEIDKNNEVAKLFVDKKIPARFRKKGQASPVLYSD